MGLSARFSVRAGSVIVLILVTAIALGVTVSQVVAYTDGMLQRSLTAAEQLSLATQAEAALVRAFYESEPMASHDNTDFSAKTTLDQWQQLQGLLAALDRSLVLEQGSVLSAEEREVESQEGPLVRSMLAQSQRLRTLVTAGEQDVALTQYRVLAQALADFRGAEADEVTVSSAAIEQFRQRITGWILAISSLPLGLAVYFLWQLAGQHRALEEEVSRRTDELQTTARELAEVDRQRRLFFAKIGHELRTPLTVVLAEADLGCGDDGISGTTATRFARISTQAGLLARRVRDLLALAQSEAGQLQLECAPVEFCRIAEAVERLAAAHADQFGVDVSVVNQCSADLELLADAEWLTQALMALVDNAIKVSLDHQRVDIRLAETDDGWISMAVLDQGPGLPDTVLPDLGTPFVRYLGTVNESGRRGTGLGLAVARWVAEAHEGGLELTNRPEGGLQATLKFPYL